MPVLALGVSHRAASIDLLERLTFTGEDLVKAYRRAEDLPGLDEAVVLSTCNRVEVYGAVEGYHPGFVSLKRLLSETRSVGEEELSSPLYAHWERDAAAHLFGVAGGLDSMVLGETQIQAQVRDALRVARSEGAAGPVLTGLFHAATRTGRRIRRETSLGAAPDALVEAAIDLAGERLGGPDGRTAVVVGAGTMAGLVVRHLQRRGVGMVMVLNRSLERARTLAARANAEAGDLEALPDALARADLVVSATGATGIVVGAAALRSAQRSGARPLVIVDLAVPRDVDPDVARLPGVTLLDVESLRERTSEGRSSSVEAARAIVEQEVRRFTMRRRGDELAPLIRTIRRRGDAILQGELERFGPRLTDLTHDEREAVEALARGIVAKLLHDPIVALKERSEPGSGRIQAEVLTQLLGLDPSPSEEE
jgi:glutamyl-tRNA reductase